jgi:hypothetical protein
MSLGAVIVLELLVAEERKVISLAASARRGSAKSAREEATMERRRTVERSRRKLLR